MLSSYAVPGTDIAYGATSPDRRARARRAGVPHSVPVPRFVSRLPRSVPLPQYVPLPQSVPLPRSAPLPNSYSTRWSGFGDAFLRYL
eukprot:3072575-Rhodomonas_salina.5